jgi:hypothetical protein
MDDDLKPWQRHPTEAEKARAERESRECQEREREKIAERRVRLYPRGRGGPATGPTVSGGLPGLGKRR